MLTTPGTCGFLQAVGGLDETARAARAMAGTALRRPLQETTQDLMILTGSLTTRHETPSSLANEKAQGAA